MSTAATLAQRLLDAHVVHVVDRLTGDAGVALVVDEARALLPALRGVPLTAFVTADDALATAHTVLDAAGDAPAVAAMVEELAPLLYALPTSDDTPLGDVVQRGHVDAVVDRLARSTALREELLRRLGQSPVVSALALRFVQALVGDAVQQNRQRAEKLPGAKLALGMGDLAARSARGLAPKQLEKVVGGAADKGAQAAMERVSRALLDTLDESAVHAAVLEIWDLHAADTVAGLRAYLTQDEVEALAGDVHAAWLDLRTAPWFAAVVEAVVGAFFDRYGDQPLGTLLDELGLDDDTLVAIAERHAPAVLAALHRDGAIEEHARRLLGAFYSSDAALAVLADA